MRVHRVDYSGSCTYFTLHGVVRHLHSFNKICSFCRSCNNDAFVAFPYILISYQYKLHPELDLACMTRLNWLLFVDLHVI